MKSPPVPASEKDGQSTNLAHGESAPGPRASGPYGALLSLQRMIGNRAVGRLIRSGVMQTKLRIGQPNDRYEQEADRVADAVMRKPEPSIAVQQSDHPPAIQRHPDDPSPPQGGTSCLPTDSVENFCQPYGSRQEARRIRDCILRRYVPLLADVFGSEVGSLWRSYLSRRHRANLRRRVFSSQSSQIVQGFVASVTTNQRQRVLVDRIKQSLRSSCPRLPANHWADFSVNRFLSRQDLDYPIDYNQALEIPGHIAGSVGSSDAGPDSRRVSGTVSLLRSTDRSGRTTGIRIATAFNFVVRDAIDFCPGQPGGEAEQMLTIPLSRLEMTGLFLRDEPFAYDVPFEVRFRGTPIEEDLDFSSVRACYPDAAPPATEAPAPETEPEPEEPGERFLEGLIRRKSNEHSTLSSESLSASAPPRVVGEVVRGVGRRLDLATRASMEARFGWDFGSVRIHTDEQAARSAQALQARAFTTGRHIVFGKGQYAPGTTVGQRLLAHELTHVLQQSNDQSGVGRSVPITPVTARDGDLLLQREFDRTRLASYLRESYNRRVIPSRREEAITRLLDNKDNIVEAATRHGVNKVSFAAAVLWQELYFRGADLTSGIQDIWSAYGPVGGADWSLGFGQVRPSTATQVIGDIPFRPRSERAITEREYEALPWKLRMAYRMLLAHDDSYNIYIAVGYLAKIKERRYPTIPWLSLDGRQLAMIASEYSHGPYDLRYETPNHNGEQAMTIWWGGWFGTRCIQAEFPNLTWRAINVRFQVGPVP